MTLEDRFKTPDAAAQFRAAYDETLALSGVSCEAIAVNTSYGMAHVNAAGTPEAPPVVLIHGAQASSTSWYATLGPLSRSFRVYAPDVIDQMGLSVPTRKLKTQQDCGIWMNELLDGLHIERAVIVGHSQGGWQALNLAITAPQRVERLVLLSPSGSLSRLRWQMLFRMLPVFIRPNRTTFYRAFQWSTTMPVKGRIPLVEQFMLGAMGIKPGELSLGVVAVFKDEQLRQVKAPTLLLAGEQDNTCHPRYDIERARRLIPSIEADLIPGGGHLFPVDQADATNARILDFLRRA